MKKTFVYLTDEEMAALDGRCETDTQAKVTDALARIDARRLFTDVSPAVAGLISDMKAEAAKHGQLVFRHRRIRSCPLCDVNPGYATYLRGRNRGKPNYDRPLMVPGLEFAQRWVFLEGSVDLGGCRSCLTEEVLEAIKNVLKEIIVQLPDELYVSGPQYRRWRNMTCGSCGWTGDEGQMGDMRAYQGGTGWQPYKGSCPACPAQNLPLDSPTIVSTDGFVVYAPPDASVDSASNPTP